MKLVNQITIVLLIVCLLFIAGVNPYYYQALASALCIAIAYFIIFVINLFKSI
jgi:hypothetical protein